VLGVARGPAPFAISSPPPTGPAGSTFSPATSQAQPTGARGRKLLVSGLLGAIGLAGFAVGALLVLRGARHAEAVAPSAVATAPEAGVTASAPLLVPTGSSPGPAPSAVLDPAPSAVPIAAPPAAPIPVASKPPPGPATGPRAALRPSAASPAAPSGSAGPACRTISYFDTDGNKHFKQECR
jgi:hypothetical protein